MSGDTGSGHKAIVCVQLKGVFPLDCKSQIKVLACASFAFSAKNPLGRRCLLHPSYTPTAPLTSSSEEENMARLSW